MVVFIVLKDVFNFLLLDVLMLEMSIGMMKLFWDVVVQRRKFINVKREMDYVF